jgi:CDP-diglyceride synthetase
MAASPLPQPSPQPSRTAGIISAQRASESALVPASWRVKQLFLIGLVALLAIWYALGGWRSPGSEANAADSLSAFDFIGFALLGLLVWLTTPIAWTIAVTAFHEAIRRKWMTALLGFAVVMLAVSTFFTWMQPGEEQKFLRDYGIGFTVIMTLIAAIFLGVAMIPPEVERRISHRQIPWFDDDADSQSRRDDRDFSARLHVLRHQPRRRSR